MPRLHEYATGTPQMLEKDAARKRRRKRRAEQMGYHLIRGPLGVVLHAASLVILGCAVYSISYASQEERRVERETALLDIETTCTERGGSFAFSGVSDDVVYCYEKGENILFEVEGLSGSPEKFTIADQHRQKNTKQSEIK
jgi:hypothetical protein